VTCTPIPCGSLTPFPTLFSHFPRSHITIGTAERLTREVSSLAGAMEKDGVDVSVHWARDACHDVLVLPPGWWDRKVVEEVWESISHWAEGFLEAC
jgi:acetyl esterase/lipase